MSENIGKLLFECANSWAWFRGVIESETDKTYMVRVPGSRVTSRTHKTKMDVLLPSGTDPKAADQRYRDAIRAFDARIAAARDALSAIQHEQKQSAIEALKSAVSP